MHKAYCQSMRLHIHSLTMQLAQLEQIERPLNQFESLAAGRLIQVLIEACIGLAKHWVKHKRSGVVTDANRAFVLLAQHGEWTEQTLDWHRIICMRNALVHDYLNIDQRIILDVIKQRRYQDPQNFAEQALSKLEITSDTD